MAIPTDERQYGTKTKKDGPSKPGQETLSSVNNTAGQSGHQGDQLRSPSEQPEEQELPAPSVQHHESQEHLQKQQPTRVLSTGQHETPDLDRHPLDHHTHRPHHIDQHRRRHHPPGLHLFNHHIPWDHLPGHHSPLPDIPPPFHSLETPHFPPHHRPSPPHLSPHPPPPHTSFQHPPRPPPHHLFGGPHHPPLPYHQPPTPHAGESHKPLHLIFFGNPQLPSPHQNHNRSFSPFNLFKHLHHGPPRPHGPHHDPPRPHGPHRDPPHQHTQPPPSAPPSD